MMTGLTPVALSMGGTDVGIFNPIPVTPAPKGVNQTIKTFTGSVTTQTGATTVTTLYTVTTGKTFYITDFVSCNNSTNPSTVSLNSSIAPGASPIIIGHSQSTAPFNAIDIASEPFVAGGLPLVFQAGQTSAATSVTYFVAGYEQ
jgi:hypothetical protein